MSPVALVPVVVSLLAAAPQVAVGPRPAWVEPVAVDHAAPPPANDVAGGTYDLLDDAQVRVSGARDERHFRHVIKILSEVGVEQVSELKVEFDPTFEHLTFHAVDLYRDGRRIDALVPGDINLLHIEEDLDRQLYAGSLSALLILRDVRPGDVLDYSYTIGGANPILGGKFVAALTLGGDAPLRHLHRRVIAPAGRTLHYRVHGADLAPRVEDAGGLRSLTWERRDVRPIEDEDHLPGWYDPYPWVQLSEFGSWREVADWARALFAAAGDGGAEVAAVAARIAAATPGAAERVVAAARFVQDEVRYFGVEIGPSSHRPHRPEQVLAQRFGDCKDKAVLLVALLARLGIEAWPAMVDTETGPELDRWLPTAFAFDHAIVTATLGGERLWIDATDSLQGGGIEAFRGSPLARALVLEPGASGLVSPPPRVLSAPTTDIEETYLVGAGGKARLEVKSTYLGADADAVRAELAQTSPGELARHYLNHYAHDDPGIRSVAPPVVSDDRPHGRLIVGESYQLPEFWNEDEREVYAWSLEEVLEEPRIALRSMPIGLEHPVHLQQRIRVKLEHPPDVAPDHTRVRHPAFEFDSAASVEGSTLTLTYRYRSLADAVPAAESGRYLRALARARDALGYVVSSGDLAPAVDEPVSLLPGAASSSPASSSRRARPSPRGLALGALVALLLGWALVRRANARRVAWVRRTGFAPGEAPASALRVRDSAEIGGALVRARCCSCGATLLDERGERRSVRYDEGTMTVITRSCTACSCEQTLYIALDR